MVGSGDVFTSMKSADIDTVIVGHPFLRGMKPEHLRLLASCAMECSFAQSEVIFREGDPANRFYLLREGQVALEAPPEEGDSFLIQVVGAGDVLGWSWMFPPFYWHFTARALAPTDAIFFYGTRLREECEQNPALGYDLVKRVAQVLLERLQFTRRHLLELHKKSS